MSSPTGEPSGGILTRLKNWGASPDKTSYFFPLGTFLATIYSTYIYFRGYGWGFNIYDLPVHPWSILGYQFTHVNLDHLAWNMLFLMFIGPSCEKYLGHLRWALFYLSAGAISALGYGLYNPETILVGASGSIAALMAIYPFIQRSFVGLILSGFGVLFYFVTQFSLSLKTAQTGVISSTAYLVHVAGAVAGLILFAALNRRRK